MLDFNQNIKIGDRMIGPDYPTYIIAEIGGNFDGSLEKAKRLIDAAKEAGADCAKFQTFKAESIVSEGGFSKMQLHGVHGSWGRTVSEVFKDVELPLEWHQELADYCKTVGIDFSTSPYNKEAVDSFLGMVRKYTDVTELTAEIIRSFVERIEVLKPEKVPGTRTKKQTIVIYWNFIGAVEIAVEQEKTA